MATILIIEDEAAIRAPIAGAFREAGYSVSEAADGEAGLVSALRDHPDVILLDIILPKMHGIAMLQKLREDTWGRRVPVILLTNLSDSESVAGAIENGAYDFLVKKDWKPDEVVHMVAQRIKRSN
ncbi:MAG: response regulator [bacterium]|nr:response regulator [bacterium]